MSTTDGSFLPGVTVEARSNVLPQPRTTITSETGDYRLPALAPGTYTLTFTLAGMGSSTRNVQVLLGQDAPVNVSLGIEGLAESITVTADASLVENASTAIKSALGEPEIESLPVAQEYRDLVKLAPAVTYTEDTIRGPSSGGSGQDNTYQFDGVNVTLPLFGTLSAEPSTHDIQQMSVIKGGAKAVDFVRAAGFTIDTVSKSGTSEFQGELGYQFETEAMRGRQIAGNIAQYDQDRAWITANIGGPAIREMLFFYGSYYRPTVERTNRTNVYGALPTYDSTRDELFGKLTYTPMSNLLLNGSYRNSTREVGNASINSTAQASTALNEEAELNIGIFEASWVLNERSFATAKFTDFENLTSSIPNIALDIVPTTAPGTKLDINNLDQYGLLSVPSFQNNQPAYNAFITPLIERYGYTNAAGVRTGGSEAGAGSQFNDNDFFRQSAQAGYDLTLGTGSVAHDLHVGYLWSKDAEDLRRVSNGWGVISAPRGITFQGQPVSYQAQFTRSQSGGVGGNNIHSEYVTHNVELNDTIRWGNWAFNAGLVVSQDTFYGQGLREDSSAPSGFVLAPGNKYEMYQVPWSKQIQPRLGATWAYNGSDNVYASYARYVPSASSLPRAASWDRNILGLTTRVHFDATGTIIGSEQVSSSSGKLFQEDMDPRHTDEYLIGTSQQFTAGWSGRAYGRYRYSTNFWEDTQNNARVQWAPAGYPKELYIADLPAKLAPLGGGSNNSYVIAQLDNAFTKYYEGTLESDWRGGNTFLRGSYTWSHYYGNFDQDNTSLDNNDTSIFIGSSSLADGPGRQIWDNKYGDLRGDRRHLLKVYGSYSLPWAGTVGVFGLYQSGQPWEAWNYELYSGLPGFGTSTSDQARYAEPAGRRRSPDHYQVDMTYTQDVPFAGLNFQFQLDAFNVFDNQTGYNYEPSVHRITTAIPFGTPRDYFDPRRFQAALRLQF